MKKINIFGAGLYGIFLSKTINEYVKKKNKHYEINIFEKSNSILSAWKSKNIQDFKVNNGFHGIEMPRAKKTSQILNDLGCANLLINTSNLRLIYINILKT